MNIIKYIIAIFVFIPTVMAQSFELEKPVICSSTAVVFQALLEQAGEQPIWLGFGTNGDTSKTTILANPKTKTWTIVQFDKDNACVLGSGMGNRQIFNGPII